MSDFGWMGVDWEQRIDFDRMRRERLQRAQAALAETDVDALFVFRVEDSRYLTGHRSHLGPVAALGFGTVILHRNGDYALYTMDRDTCLDSMPWLRDDQIQGRANLRDHAGTVKWANEAKAKFGLADAAKIGVDLWTPRVEASLRSVFPKAEFVDGYEILLKAKMIKTTDELHCIRAAATLTEVGFQAALETLKPGARECEVLAAAWGAMTRLGSEWTQCANIVASGPYTAPYRRFTSDRIIREGDPVVIDIGGCFNGYWGDFTRTFICGNVKPTAEQVALHQQCYNALFSACATARVGKTNYDVFMAAQPCVRDNLGHGAGVSPWEPPYFSASSKDEPVPLRQNMVLNLEPYAGKPGVGGFRLENNVIVRDGDPEIFTTLPFDERLLNDVHPLDRTTGRRAWR
ncbi:MAG TPA: Xaa-Pro peptidase family protein [bacterium]|nr:Xaa-Pro peptidase family protein [bacterium]